MKNLLVMGGAGYIGSHFCKIAKKNGFNPIVFDNLSTGHKEAIKFGEFVEGDLKDTSLIEETLKKYNIYAVIHFAAKALVGESMEYPEKYYLNNVCGTISLLQAMLNAGVKKIVFSSTAATYGNPNKDPISEDTSQKPINPYGMSKLICEKMILDFQRLHGFKTALLRYFNVIGQDSEGEISENHDPETHLIPNIIKALKTEKEFYLFGTDYPTSDGTCVRDYVDVNDLAKAHLKALDYLENKELLISNIGRGHGYSVKEVFDAFKKVFGKAPPLIEKPRREGDPPKLIADNTFFQKWCDIKLKTLEESLEILKKNYKD